MASGVNIYSHSYKAKDVWVSELMPDDDFLAEIRTKLAFLDMGHFRLSE